MKSETKHSGRRYTFKLYPDPRQDMELSLQCRMVAQLWNAMLEVEEQQYRRNRDGDGKSFLSRFDLSYQVTEMCQQIPEWRALSVWTPHRVAHAITLAFQAFFRRAKGGAGASSGYPRYRSSRRADWLPHRFASGCKMIYESGSKWKLRLKGVTGEIAARGKLPGDPSKWTDADIRRDAAGVWWLSAAVEMPQRMVAGEKERSVEFDGIDCFARVDGTAVYAHEVGVQDDPRIAELQQKMAEFAKGSRDWHQLRVAKARIQANGKRKRREMAHEWTTRIVRSASGIDMTIPNDLKAATASGRGDKKEWGAAVDSKAEFNRTILSQAPAAAAAMIRYKAGEAGIAVVERKSEQLDSGNMVVAMAKMARIVRRQVKGAKEVLA